MPKITEKDLEVEFRRGFYCAVTNLVSLHGRSIEAEEVLRSYGAVNFKGISDFNKEKLLPLAKEISRKNK